MARSQRTKLALKDLGEPAMVKTIVDPKEKAKGYFLGTLAGIATGFVTRKNPKDETEVFEGLAGTFRSIPGTDDRDELESGILFIPDAFHNMIAVPLRQMLSQDPNSQLKFAFEIRSVVANNPAGYSWDFTPLADPDAKNPMDEFLSTLGSVKVVGKEKRLAIADHSKVAAIADHGKAAAKK